MTPELIKQLENALFENDFQVTKAAKTVGIHRDTLRRWLKRYPSLAVRLRTAYNKRWDEQQKREDPVYYAKMKEIDRRIQEAAELV